MYSADSVGSVERSCDAASGDTMPERLLQKSVSPLIDCQWDGLSLDLEELHQLYSTTVISHLAPWWVVWLIDTIQFYRHASATRHQRQSSNLLLPTHDSLDRPYCPRRYFLSFTNQLESPEPSRHRCECHRECRQRGDCRSGLRRLRVTCQILLR